MVSMLTRKLRRDLMGMKGQVITIALVVAAGVASMVMYLSGYESLIEAQRSFYARARFADAFVEMRRAPLALASRIGEIPGVSAWETRLVAQFLLDMPKVVEPVAARILSLPEFGEPRLNRPFLRRGRMPESNRGGEVLVNEGFAAAHGLTPGDRITAIVNGRRQALRVTGIALSPEYIFAMSGGSIMPDDLRFGVFWMPEPALAAAFDLKGAFNSASVTLAAGASLPAVLAALDALAAPYGSLGAYGRSDQLSHRLLSDEIRQQRTMATVVPPIFLTVACFLVFIVTGRLVRVQREQIASLKALGYSNRDIGLHFVQMVSVIILIGSVVGVIQGSAAGSAITDLYRDFFRFPILEFQIPVFYALLATGTSWGAAMAGALTSVRWATRLPPAHSPAAPGS